MAALYRGGLETTKAVATETDREARRGQWRRGGDSRDIDRATLVRATVEVRLALEAAVVAAVVATQRAIDVADVLQEALVILEEAPGASAFEPAVQPRPDAIDSGNVLSPREREVLELVAEGRSNKAIAEALYVSPNTVKTHVTSLLHKLRVESRIQLAAIAARQAQR